jgi:hypothetical protein
MDSPYNPSAISSDTKGWWDGDGTRVGGAADVIDLDCDEPFAWAVSVGFRWICVVEFSLVSTVFSSPPYRYESFIFCCSHCSLSSCLSRSPFSRPRLLCNTEIRMTCKCLPIYAALVREATNIRVSQSTIYLPTGIRVGSTLSHPATVIEARAFGLP